MAGPRNSITDVPGILVGQAEDGAGITGTTVVLVERPAVASVDIRGGAPGTRETDLLGPDTLVDRVDAVVLSGGSAFGLDAAAGVMEWLAAAGRGFAVGSVRSGCRSCRPRSCSTSAFPAGGCGPARRPTAPSAASAVDTAAKDFALGNAGAGRGATAGRLKGGIGTASLVLADGATVGAIVAVNSWGSTVRPDCGRFWAAELALARRHRPTAGGARPRSRPGGFFAMRPCRPGRQHDDRRRRHRRRARQGRLPAPGDHGPGRAGARDPPDPYAVRRRQRVCAVDRSRPAGRRRRCCCGSAAPLRIASRGR